MAEHEDVGIAVIGAGIAGLTFALMMRSHGVQVVVYDQVAELAEVGAAVALAANGCRVLDRLGLLSSLEQAATEPVELVFRHGLSGRRIFAQPMGEWYRDRFGAPFLGLHRIVLQQNLAQAWGKRDLCLNSRLVGIRPAATGMELTFEAGRTVRARLVVGADGVHSVVRRIMFGARPVYSGSSGFRGLVPLKSLPGLPDPHTLQFWTGPAAHLLHYPVGDKINFLAVLDTPATWPGRLSPQQAGPGKLSAAFADWHPEVRQMVTAVPQSARWPLLTLPYLGTWSRDRVVLLGDAAHAMLPHQGQGANQSLEDAMVLADCLADADVGHEQAFARYTGLRRARTRLVQSYSRSASTVLHLPDGPSADDRDANLRHLPDQLAWIHDWPR